MAPEAYTEHPNWPANYGAWYVSQMLDILTSNPVVWSRTVLLITYDENDGFFDHAVPPTPPQTAAQGLSTVSTADEIFPGSTEYMPGPYGLGARVPMLVVSPWSKGGYVNSQLFDHTSVIRFIEQRFGRHDPALSESNITPWRRAVAGDLTSAFNFRTPNDAAPSLPNTASFMPPDAVRHPSYVPVPPVVQAVPAQEKGLRRARALPYVLLADGTPDLAAGGFAIAFGNTGTVGTVYQVRSANPLDLPRSYTVEPGKRLADRWAVAVDGGYDLSVTGANGFLRAFRGNLLSLAAADVAVVAREDRAATALALEITNHGRAAVQLALLDNYTRRVTPLTLASGQTRMVPVASAELYGWYDLSLTASADQTFLCHVAGHIETGQDSVTDPAIGI